MSSTVFGEKGVEARRSRWTGTLSFGERNIIWVHQRQEMTKQTKHKL
jgi:hypothetical protein